MRKVLVPGVFDVFHIGHLNYLKQAAAAGDYLVVAVQEDRAVEKAKGTAMVTPLPERVALIEQLRFVDEVVSYIDVYQGPLLQALGIDVFACGEEYGHDAHFPDQIRTLEYCRANNVEVFRIPRTTHVSSTEVRAKLKAFWASRAAKASDLPAGVTTLGSFSGDQERIRQESQKEAELVLSAVTSPHTLSILDLGCGDGRLLELVAPQFKTSIGVDFAKELLDLARHKFTGMVNQPQLIEADVAHFKTDGVFDVILLSGITPCLDDQQLESLMSNISTMSHSHATCLVRTSISLNKRINIVNQFSPDLGTTYTAYYRTIPELESMFLAHGWKCNEHFQLYQHRPDTAVWWFQFRR